MSISKYLGFKMGQASRSVVATAASRQLATSLAYNVNILQMSEPLLGSAVRIIGPGIRMADRPRELSTRHVFKRLLKCYHGLSEPAFCICLFWHAAISTSPYLANVSTSSGSTHYH